MHHQRPQVIVSAVVVWLIALVMAGCGAAATPAAPPLAPPDAATEAAIGAPQSAAMAATMPAPTAAIASIANGPSADQAKAGSDQLQGTPGPGDQTGNGAPQGQMVIKNGEIALLVQDTHTAIDQVTQIAVDNGGYVLTSQASQDTRGVTNATITIAVRADQFETALRRLREIALDVQSETSTGQDVSSEYVDLNSRLTNLEATRDRIAKLLDSAKTVDEALTINQQLSDIEGQIEQVKGRMNYLTGRSAFSTITVTLNQKVDATPTPTPTLTPTPTSTPIWSLGPTIKDATSAQLDLFHMLLTLAVWIVLVPGPYLVVAGIGFWGFSLWTRRRKPGGTGPATPGAGTSHQ